MRVSFKCTRCSKFYVTFSRKIIQLDLIQENRVYRKMYPVVTCFYYKLLRAANSQLPNKIFLLQIYAEKTKNIKNIKKIIFQKICLGVNVHLSFMETAVR